jgi:hypothetical protein
VELEVRRLLDVGEGQEPTAKQREKAVQEIQEFLAKLRQVKILDPACGTGNFLYVTLDLLKGLEQEALTRLVDVAGNVQLGFEQVDPSQFLGIEINPRAAAIAELVIWIGYLQWYFKRYGSAASPDPVLQAFGNIECRDAVLAYDGREPDVDAKTGEVRTRWGGRMMKHVVTGEDVPDPSDRVVIYRYLNAREAEWPEADYIVSNPPFIGNRAMREILGDGYAEMIRDIYQYVPDTADYVMYWWHKAANIINIGKSELQRFGFITTNTIRQVWQRKIIDHHINHKHGLRLIFAIPDHPWINDGASVRIAMTGAELDKKDVVLPRLGLITSEEESETPEIKSASLSIEWKIVDKIFSDLSFGIGIDKLIKLKSNKTMNICCPGIKLHGIGFCLTKEQAVNTEADIVFPYLNGRDLSQSSRDVKVIDLFGLNEDEVREKYPQAYQWVYNHVKPERDKNNRASYRNKWWIFGEPRTTLRPAIKHISRYIGTPQTSKHRVFSFIDSSIVPDQQIIVIASEDAYILGVLSTSIHVKWCLVTGGSMGVYIGNIRYNNSVCFDPFPFPNPTPEKKQKIRELADRLDSHRKQVQSAHPEITITGMYNLLEKLRAGQEFTEADRAYNNKALVSTLQQIHDQLDQAVFTAYGWQDLWAAQQTALRQAQGTAHINETILERLVALNAERAAEPPPPKPKSSTAAKPPKLSLPPSNNKNGQPPPKPNSPPSATSCAPAAAHGQHYKLPTNLMGAILRKNSMLLEKISID